jgi:predicted glycosyltransferase
MNILFDLVHPADVNLFKQTVYQLKQDHHKVIITLRKRGVLQQIAEKEFPDFNIIIAGSHKKTSPGKILAFVGREFYFYRFLKRNKVDVAVCQGVSFGFTGKILNVPIIHHDDDHEYKLTYLMGKYLAYKVIMPDFMPVSGSNFVKYRGFKELAYLHPKYFNPNLKCLDFYNLNPFNYVFIREIANVSVNYKGRLSFLNEILVYLKKKGLKVILSLEDKSNIAVFEKHATVLKEPITNLYSLMYYSHFIISSGDTMARESSLMGVPCIYTGGRSMSVNDVLIQKGIMFKMDKEMDIKKQIDKLWELQNGEELRGNMSKFVNTHYDDLNKIILEQIFSVKH